MTNAYQAIIRLKIGYTYIQVYAVDFKSAQVILHNYACHYQVALKNIILLENDQLLEKRILELEVEPEKIQNKVNHELIGEHYAS